MSILNQLNTVKFDLWDKSIDLMASLGSVDPDWLLTPPHPTKSAYAYHIKLHTTLNLPDTKRITCVVSQLKTMKSNDTAKPFPLGLPLFSWPSKTS